MDDSLIIARVLVETQERERGVIARELHDRLGQSLAVLKLLLGDAMTSSPDRARYTLGEAQSLINEMMSLTRELSLELRPKMLDDLGLLPALRWIAEQSAARGGFTVTIDSAIPLERLAPEIETACFRIVQEALTNIIRHAHAARVAIELLQEGGSLLLCVRDDGVGFDIAAMHERALAGGSIGVLGMQERAVLIGGELEIVSNATKGSAIRVRCPMRLRGVQP